MSVELNVNSVELAHENGDLRLSANEQIVSQPRDVKRVLMVCPELPTAENPGSMAPAARQIESISDLGITTEVVDMRGIPKLKYLLAVGKIRSLSRDVDLIHAHFGFCGWLAKIASFGIHKPVVMSFMGDDLLGTPREDGSLEWLSKIFVRWNQRLAKSVNQVIVKSSEMATVIEPIDSVVVPNGVDMERFQPIDKGLARARLDFPIDEEIVLFPGNPDNPRKGYSLAKKSVDAASAILEKPLKLIPLWNIAPNEVPLYMNACSVMLMTSLIEGSPNVVKEALACNTPVIGVPVGDVQQMLNDITACNCCERNPQQIATAMADVIANGLACNGREVLFERGLDLHSVAQKISTIYDETYKQYS